MYTFSDLRCHHGQKSQTKKLLQEKTNAVEVVPASGTSQACSKFQFVYKHVSTIF